MSPKSIIIPLLLSLIAVNSGCDERQQTQIDKDMFKAIISGNVAEIERLIADGADVNVKDSHGYTSLHSAVRAENLLVMKLLIEKGAKVRVRNDYGDTPLHAAASGGRIDAVRLLIAKGAKVNAKNNNGKTPIFPAAASGNMEMVKFLIDKGAKIPKKGLTPLQDAVGVYYVSSQVGTKQCLAMVNFFLDKGVELNASSDLAAGETTALHLAAWSADKEVLEFLIEKGAKVNAEEKTGRTPLYVAAMARNIGAAEVLLANGADVNANFLHGTALHAAVSLSNLGGFNAKISPDGKMIDWRVPLVKLLLAKGADPNIKDRRQSTSLHIAIGRGWPDPATNMAIAQALLESGADPNIKDRSGRTALSLAKGKPEIIKLLQKHGAK